MKLFTKKRRMRVRSGGTARSQLIARQNQAVTSLGSGLPPALGVKGYKRSKKVWP